MTHDFVNDHHLSDQLTKDLLDDLAVRRRTDIAKVRELTAIRRKAALTIRPANVGDRASFAASGATIELRRQAATCMFPVPVAVGDVFHVEFARDDLDLPTAFAICERCAMLGDTSFEVLLRFVQEIALPDDTAAGRGV